MATLATQVYSGHQPFAAVTAVTATQSVQEQPNEEQYITTFFCRALYDYQTQDTSSLSFRRNDIIEVLTRLESGWWDGLLGEERGWFPSNYVQVISDEEAEAALSATEDPEQKLGNGDESVVDMSHALVRDRSASETEREWLDNEAGQAGSRNGLLELAQATMDSATQSSDFWMPQVTPDGQIYYVNTQTGQHSRDLPQEADDDTSDGDLAGLTSQSSSRSGTSAGLGLSPTSTPDRARSSREHIHHAGFGVSQRMGTPEPWMRRLADDGMSYYYWNKLDGQVRWTRPDPEPTSSREGSRPPHRVTPRNNSSMASYEANRDTIIAPNRLRADSSASQSRQRNDNMADRLSLFSDDSDVEPRDLTQDVSVSAPAKVQNGQYDRDTLELTSTERLAQSLQQALSPPPPELVTDLSVIAQQAITAVVQSIQLHGSQRRAEQEKTLDDLVRAVVLAVRNLLYVSAAPTGHIPSNLIPRDARDPQASSASQTLLKPAQRKVTATLSKLVLSARAMQYDSGSSANETPNRIEGDAEELERAVLAFVLEVQRSQNEVMVQQLSGKGGLKRLRGVFLTANVGLGLMGAGAAGSWRGFGWVAPADDEEAPGRVLGMDVVTELRSYRLLVEEKFAALALALRGSESDSVERVTSEGRDIVAHLSTFLAFVANIHVARHVDVDGVHRDTGHAPSDDVYAQNVAKARLLVRTLEVAVQSLYDDGTSLLLTVHTGYHHTDAGQSLHDRDASYDYLGALATSLKANLGVVQQTLEALLSVGHDQADLAHGDYNGSIEWRMSRLSVIGDQFGQHMRSISADPFDAEKEDIVNLEDAFQKPGTLKIPQPLDPSLDRPPMYQHQSHPSDHTLNMSEDPRPGNGDITATSTEADESTNTLVRPSSPDAAEGFEDEPEPSSRAAPRAHKLKDILGPEVPQHYINTINADQKPWYLRPNYSQTEILIDPDGAVRGGTVQALVERLTAHEHGDPTFIKTFLMTYKSFTNLDELFNLLVQRFWIQPPDNLKQQELDEWGKLKQHVIQMRVLNTFKSMVVDEDVLEKEDMYILERMKEFVSNEEVVRFAAAKQLLILIERARGGDAKIKTMITTTQQTPPAPIMPKNLKKLKILDIDPLELARQLTIMESSLYQKIRPMECLQRSREQRVGDNNDNIAQIIQTSNKIANWVADAVLSKEDSRRRATIVKQFILVADRCRGMHNYSSMVAIVSGLNSTPIRRLKRTWEQVNARLMAQLSACEMTIDTNKNFNNYRSTMAKVSPPCVPFIGVFLTTLTFIQDGSKDDLPGNLINFRKRQKASEVIQDIKRWQSVPFSFVPIPALLVYLEESLNQFQDQGGIADQLWNLSLEREPREREDEKMARLLQESGFL